MISDSSNLLSNELVGFIISKFEPISITSFKNQDMRIICELAKYSSQPSPENMRKILNILWRIVKGEATGLPEEAIEKAKECFCDVITTPRQVPEELMKEYFDQCYKMIKEGNNPMLAFKVLKCSMIQLQYLPTCNYIDKIEMISLLLSEGHVFENFFIDLKKATEETKTKIANNTFNIQTYKKETLIREEFMMFWLEYSNYKLSKSDLEVLWVNWVKAGISLDDQVLFYKFLKELCLVIVKHITSMDDLKDFFVEIGRAHV